MSEKIPIKNSPKAQDLWKGIGGHFDSFDQILCEFVDNSISNFVANNLLSKTIIITIKEQPDKSVIVSIEDSGTGLKNLDAAFCLGNTSQPETPLNEHGFGMKHALASANPQNNNWLVYTRTKEDHASGAFKKIASPYEIENFGGIKVRTAEEAWPGDLNGSGTLVRFHCSRDLFYTVKRGVQGGVTIFNTLIAILAEDLGFIYAGLILENKATITIAAEDKDGARTQNVVTAVQPEWKQFYNPGQGTDTFDLGVGNVELKYSFGAIKVADKYKYYKRNMSSSGLEIRINGRVLSYNVFKEVWGRETHNKYNQLLVMVDIRSDNRLALPATRTSKNGIREGDGKLDKLYEWVRKKMPDPKEELQDAHDEGDLFDALKKAKVTHLPAGSTVERELNVYKNIKARIPIDLYIHQGNEVIIYEGKKDETSVKDVYQLKMYWDGCVLDGLQPTRAILISAAHSGPVLELIKLVNQMKDLKGGFYKIESKLWKDENIPYPN